MVANRSFGALNWRKWFSVIKGLLSRMSDTQLYKIGIQLLPISAIKESHRVASNQASQLFSSLEVGDRSPFTVWIDQRYSAPGFGDLLIALALANVLNELGLRVRLYWNDFSDSATQVVKEKTIKIFLDRGVELIPKDSDSTVSEIENLLFEELVHNKRDITVPSLQLLNQIFSNQQFLKRLSKPYWRAFNEPSAKTSSKTLVGIHVRHSASASFRNPDDEQTLRDLLRLRELIPDAEIVWFGEASHYQKFIEKHSLILAQYGVGLSRQNSHNFADAAVEALGCNFWFQRWGGGIGAAIWFSPIPYLMISNDFILRQLFKVRGRRIVSWATPTQIYDLRLLRKRQNIRRGYVQVH